MAARRRLLPALASLLGVAIDRERLTREALEAEALRRSDAMKTALLRAVSHDLRSPLMAILTVVPRRSRATTSSSIADDRHELLATIPARPPGSTGFVANLLDLSRLQAGAARPEAEAVVGRRPGRAGARGGRGRRRRVEVSLPDRSPTVRVDAHQIERVLANLIENALKYSPQDEPVRVQVVEHLGVR